MSFLSHFEEVYLATAISLAASFCLAALYHWYVKRKAYAPQSVHNVFRALFLVSVMAPLFLSGLGITALVENTPIATPSRWLGQSFEALPPLLQSEGTNSIADHPTPAATTTLFADFWVVFAILPGLAMFFWRVRRLVRFTREMHVVKQIGRTRLCVHPQANAPMSFSLLWQTYLVLPSKSLQSGTSMRLIVAHEATHVRRHDLMFAWIVEACLALQYWNPFIYLWQRLLINQAELSCDAVTSTKVGVRTYAEGLVRIAHDLAPCSPRFAAVGMAHGILSRRIEMLFVKKSFLSVRSRRYQTAGLLAAGLTATLMVTSLGSSEVSQKALPKDWAANLTPDLQAELLPIARRHLEASSAEEVVVVAVDLADRKAKASLYLAASDGSIAVKNTSPYHVQPMPVWSLAKPLVLAVALENQRVELDQLFETFQGRYPVGDKEVSDYMNLGQLSARDAVALSSNVAAVQIAEHTGTAQLLSGLQKFGFSALRNHQADEQTFAAQIALGYGPFQATIPELLDAYATLILASDSLASPTAHQAVSPETSHEMRKVLESVVERGTARTFRGSLKVGGKTGTGLRFRHLGEGDNDTRWASFIGYAPAEAPRWLIYTMLNGKAVEGGKHAVPLFQDSLGAIAAKAEE